MAWLTDWTYRKSHEIAGETGAGTDYQVGIKVYFGSGTDGTEVINGATFGIVYCNSKCKADFGDIRFTDDDGETKLDYWMEEKTDSVSATFWVEVADSLESGNVTIYLYYGKNDATTISNGSDTFIAWDDFDLDYSVGDPPKATRGWTYDLDVTIQQDPADASNLVARIVHPPNYPLLYNSFPTGYEGIAVHYRTRTAAFTRYGPYSRDTENDLGISCFWPADKMQWYNGSAYQDFVPNLGVSINTWYSFVMRLIPLDNVHEIVKGGVVYDGGWRQTPIDTVWIQFGRAHNSTCYIDKFFVRKYVSPEPAHGAWGSESQALTSFLYESFDFLGAIEKETTKFLSETPSLAGELSNKTGKFLFEDFESSPSLYSKVSKFLASYLSLTGEVAKRVFGVFFETLSHADLFTFVRGKHLLETLTFVPILSFRVSHRILETLEIFDNFLERAIVPVIKKAVRIIATQAMTVYQVQKLTLKVRIRTKKIIAYLKEKID